MSIKNNENSSSGNQNKMHVRINPKIKGFLVYGLKVIAAALCISAVFLGGYFTHYFSVDKNLRSIDFVLDIYEKYYLKSGDEQNPVHVLVDGLMDAYSDYYTPEEYQAYLAAGQGSRQGIGLGFSNSLTIVNVLGNSPAENAGILPGGKVIAIKTDGSEQFEQISDYSHLSQIMQTVQTGDEIYLQIDYSGEIKQFQVLKKAYTESYTFYSDDSGSYRYSDSSGSMQFVLSNRDYASVSGEWGYIKFTSFNGLSDGTMGGAGQFKGALDLFKSNKKTKLIIDLRSNGGGYVSILSEIASLLCNTQTNNSFICQRYIDNENKVSYFNCKPSKYDEYNFEKIVFLANNNSASASEALMGAVLDYDKQSGANIVNVIVEKSYSGIKEVYKTYGKGIMQQTYVNPLTGEAVKLTVAKIYWPISNICIQGSGLTPELDQRILAQNGNIIEQAMAL